MARKINVANMTNAQRLAVRKATEAKAKALFSQVKSLMTKADKLDRQYTELLESVSNNDKLKFQTDLLDKEMAEILNGIDWATESGLKAGKAFLSRSRTATLIKKLSDKAREQYLRSTFIDDMVVDYLMDFDREYCEHVHRTNMGELKQFFEQFKV